MTDNRAKHVHTALIDKVSTTYSLKDLLTDMSGPNMIGEGDEVDIPTRSAIQIERVSTGTGALPMTVQTNTPTANKLRIDEHHGAIVEIGKMNKKYDLAGTWSEQLGGQVNTELSNFMDENVFKKALLYDGAWQAGSTPPSTWVNPQGAAITQDITELALALMTSQKGVDIGQCEWVLDPWAIGGLRKIALFNQATVIENGKAAIGMRQVGYLHGLPVRLAQSAPSQLNIAITGVTVASNIATGNVPQGHGLVAAMNMVTTGLSTNATAATPILNTTETTISFALTAANGALAGGTGVVTVNLSIGGLVYKPWAFFAGGKTPSVEILGRTGGKIVDELQAQAWWGSKGLPGAFVAIGSPRRAFA